MDEENYVFVGHDQTVLATVPPLVYAIKNMDDDMFRRLLFSGLIDINAQIDAPGYPVDGFTALHMAAYFSRKDYYDALIVAGIDPNIENAHGEIPIFE